MSKDWTIDTCVLYRAASVDYDAVEFLSRVEREECRVTFDFEGHIAREYENCLKKSQREGRGGSGALAKWHKKVIAKLAQHKSGKLRNVHRRALRQLHFDPSDWPFVAVCSKTKGKRLVSEDSDYTSDVRAYLKSALGVSVLCRLTSVRTF